MALLSFSPEFAQIVERKESSLPFAARSQLTINQYYRSSVRCPYQIFRGSHQVMRRGQPRLQHGSSTPGSPPRLQRIYDSARDKRSEDAQQTDIIFVAE